MKKGIEIMTATQLAKKFKVKRQYIHELICKSKTKIDRKHLPGLTFEFRGRTFFARKIGNRYLIHQIKNS
jgi:hypothetical protein